VGLKLDKDNLREKYVEEINKIQQKFQAYGPSLDSMLPFITLVILVYHQAIEQQEEVYMKSLED